MKSEKLITVAEKTLLTMSEERVFTLPQEKVLDILSEYLDGDDDMYCEDCLHDHF